MRMKKTYLVEFSDGDIVEYCHTLRHAKRIIEKYAPNGGCIIMMKGQYFGEGFHQYKLEILNNGKYIRTRLV